MKMAPWSSLVRHNQPANDPQWNPLQWDAIAQFYPWRVFYARSMRAGHIPLWNPHQFCGTPFLANGQSAVLYPLNLVFLVFGPITAFTVFAALHLFLAQCFMYWLMRDLGSKELGGVIAAVVFAFSAFMVLWLELPTFIGVAVWLPLVLMLIHRAVERRSSFYGMLAGGGIGLAFLAGHFQIAFYVVLAAALWWLWKTIEVWREDGKYFVLLRVGAPLIACVVMAGLISAPQFLPSQELAANSHRARVVSEDGYQTFTDNALKPYRLITAFVPGFYGDPGQGYYQLLGRMDGSRHVGSAADYMEYGMYAGILPLMLAFIALLTVRRRKYIGFFAVLALLAILSAAGTPINELFYYGIPGFSALGGPNRILLLYLFGIAALAGFGADGVVDWERPKREDLLWWAGIAGLGVLYNAFYLRFIAGEIAGGADTTGEIISCLQGQAIGIAQMIFLIGLIIFLLWKAGIGTSRVFKVVVVSLIIADLFAFGINYNPTCERWKIYPQTKLTRELQRLTRNGERIAPINSTWSLFKTPDAILPPNAAMVYGLYDVQGYDSLYTRAYKDLSSKVQGIDSSPPENGNMVLIKHCTRDVSMMAQYFINREPVDDPTVDVWSVRRMDGLYISRVGPAGTWLRDANNKPTALHSMTFTFRLGLFLMLVGVGALSCVGVYRVQRCKHRKRR